MVQQSSSNNEGQDSFILNKKPIPDVTLIVHEQSLDKNLLVRIVQECHSPYFYHKFIVGNIGKSSKMYILRTISNFVYPASFRALHFTVHKNKAVFLSRNCQELVLKICSENFKIHNPECPDTPFQVIILANFILYEEVQVEDNSQNIIDVITKRFNSETETIDLKEFSEDKDLLDYYPLFQPKFLLAVTSKIAEFTPKHLYLQTNCIRDISNLDPLKDFIETIDLSNNMIQDISALMPLINFKTLKYLSLSGNPLCEKYDNYNYILDVKRYCQNLEKLDGFDVITPVFQKNLFCSQDSMDLAKNFLEHFFTVYDSKNRDNLIDLYDRNALFSVTAKIVPDQKNSTSVKLDHYGLKIPFTICSAIEIMKLFKTFPRTIHDPYPLVCDVMLFTGTHASLTVGGIFKELQQILSFTRHFIFKRSGDEFLITNEQFHVSNALDYQTGWSFGFPTQLACSGNPLPYFQEQYRELEEAVHRITTLNYEYSQKYLDYCQYDLKKTLHLFSQLHVRGDVPEKAFTPESAASKQLHQGVLPFSDRIRKLTYKKHKSINPKTIWETIHSERIQGLIVKPPSIDPTIMKIYRNVIAPTVGDTSKATTQSVPSFEPVPMPIVFPNNNQETLQKASSTPVAFNFHIPIVAKNRPVQKVKPATKADVDPLVALAEKIAKHKELAAKKAAELRQMQVPTSYPSQINQATTSVSSMVSVPRILPTNMSATAQFNQSLNASFTATNFISSSIVGSVPPPHFTSGTTMGHHFVPAQSRLGDPGMQSMQPHLMPAQFQTHPGFSMQQGFPMQHQFPVEGTPKNHTLVPCQPVPGPSFQNMPNAVFPQNVPINYPNVAVPPPTVVPMMQPRPTGVSIAANLAGSVLQPRATFPNPTAVNMVPNPASGVLQVNRNRVIVPRPTNVPLLSNRAAVSGANQNKAVVASVSKQVGASLSISGPSKKEEIGEKNISRTPTEENRSGKLGNRGSRGSELRRSRFSNRSKSRSRSHSCSPDKKRSRSDKQIRRTRSRSKDKSKRRPSRSKNSSNRSRSRSRHRRSRSRSRNRRSRSRSRNRRSRSRSKNRRSRSRSKNRRSRSRSKNRRSRSRSKNRRGRSRSQDKSKQSQSLSSKIVRPIKSPKKKNPKSGKKSENSKATKVTSAISPPKMAIASKIAKIKQVLGKISDIQESRQEQAANKAPELKYKAVTENIVDGQKEGADKKRVLKSKWDQKPQCEVAGPSSLIIERSPSGEIVKISTVKYAPASGPSIPSNVSSDSTSTSAKNMSRIGYDGTSLLSLAERKRRLDIQIQKGLKKIQKITAQRSSTNSSSNEVSSVQSDTSVEDKPCTTEGEAKETLDEKPVKIDQKFEECHTDKGKDCVLPYLPDVPNAEPSSSIVETPKSEGVSEVDEKAVGNLILSHAQGVIVEVPSSVDESSNVKTESDNKTKVNLDTKIVTLGNKSPNRKDILSTEEDEQVDIGESNIMEGSVSMNEIINENSKKNIPPGKANSEEEVNPCTVSKVDSVEVKKHKEPTEKISESIEKDIIIESNSTNEEMHEVIDRKQTGDSLEIGGAKANIVCTDEPLTENVFLDTTIGGDSTDIEAQLAVEDNVAIPKQTNANALPQDTILKVVQPCDDNNDKSKAQTSASDGKNIISAQAPPVEVPQITTDSTGEKEGNKSVNKKTTEHGTNEEKPSTCSRKKSVDESTYAIDKIVQLADGMSNPQQSSTSNMKISEKSIDTDTIDTMEMENVESSADINSKTDCSELITIVSESPDNEDVKIAADYSKKLIVQLTDIAIGTDTGSAQKIKHSKKAVDVDHQTVEPKHLTRKHDEILVPKKHETCKYLTVDLVRMSSSKNLRGEERENNGNSDKYIERKSECRRQSLAKKKTEKPSSTGKKNIPGIKKALKKHETAESRESSEEPILIPEKVPLVLVDSSDEEKSRTFEKAKEKPTECNATLPIIPITDNSSAIEEVPSTSHKNNDDTLRNEKTVEKEPSTSHKNDDENCTEPIRQDSPILLTLSSDEEDTNQDKIIFFGGDSDEEELEYIGIKDLMGVGGISEK